MPFEGLEYNSLINYTKSLDSAIAEYDELFTATQTDRNIRNQLVEFNLT